jgi:hypothetical protein
MPGTPAEVPGIVDAIGHHSYLSLLASGGSSGG